MVEQQTGWYYESRGERRGPVSQSGIMNLYSAGIIKKDTMVWANGFSDWVPFSQSGLIHEVKMGPPPVAGSAVDNTMVWVLAFMPIIGSIVEYMVMDAFNVWGRSLWFITFFLNVLFCSLDDKKLKAAGYNTDSLGSAWLIPVYLFNRAKMLAQSPSYAIVWIVTFVIMLFI